jgi:hypothetical protein
MVQDIKSTYKNQWISHMPMISLLRNNESNPNYNAKNTRNTFNQGGGSSTTKIIKH